ncbi:MAG: hypothetical protein C0594_10415 [Marinilabiliales bacterium]|nr:MAG: hypothetical protein C0594_10415 [Marinilabiliales bacterium]
MKQLILFGFIFLSISQGLYSQNNYVQYYQYINKVKQGVDKEQTDSLVYYLKQAFDLVDYVHVEYLQLGKRLAKKNKDQEFQSYCEDELKKSKENINAYLKAKLDSIAKEDQRVRGRKYYNARQYYGKCLHDTTFEYKEKKRIKAKQLMEEWWRVDSSNIELLKAIISGNGFPSEKMVGEETHSKACIIILHYDKDTANHIMGEVLHKAFREGAIKPRMYAWIIDRHLLYMGKQQVYYIIPTPWKKMSDEERKQYNSNRLSIGLKPLEEMKIVVKKNSVKVSY